MPCGAPVVAKTRCLKERLILKKQMKITAFQDVNSKIPFYTTISKALDRIKTGKSKELIEQVRLEPDRDKRNVLKSKLPSVLFSGEFSDRKNTSIVIHSGFVILDFDHTQNPKDLKQEIFKENFILACWISPSGDGVKALAKIKYLTKHREHYKSLLNYFEKLEVNPDSANINEARVCYESWDEELLQKSNCDEYENIIEQKVYEPKQIPYSSAVTDEEKVYEKLKKWIENRGEMFVEGNRNNFLMRMVAACNRTGIEKDSTLGFLATDFLHGTDFSVKELQSIIKSVYENYAVQYGIARLTDTQIVNHQTNEVLDEKTFDCDMPIKDLIYFKDVYDNLEERLSKGIVRGETTHFPILDNHYRWRRGEVSVIHGFGNHGKSVMALQLMLIKSVFCDYKWAVFNPENSPADFFYQDIAEMYAGKPFDTTHPNCCTEEERNKAKDFINEHFFYIYPKDDSPTPDYVLKRFMEVIIKHKIDGVMIDPFNQLAHDRGRGRDDHYLEIFLNKTKRFAQNQDIFFVICAHPNKPEKSGTARIFDEPSVYDLAGGAMWNNKLDNILCYHRPNFFVDPKDAWCTYSSQKIKKQKLNGIPGKVNFVFDRFKSRFFELQGEPAGGEVGFNPLEDKPNQLPFVASANASTPASEVEKESAPPPPQSNGNNRSVVDFYEPIRKEDDDLDF